jgi:DNA-binding transcriptional LysR family regulator
VAPVLDITALRSLTAIADCGGFRRAAETLCISQSAVSQHVRRLEKAIGRPLVAPDGRATRFTSDGELLLAASRRILDLHDETLARLGAGPAPAVTTIAVGTIEHAAGHLLPPLMTALTAAFPDVTARFRLDRGARLSEAIDAGSLDVAVLVGSRAAAAAAPPAGWLRLAWFSAAGWTPPPSTQPLPLVAVSDPCTIRTRALRTLAQTGRAASVVGEAGYLAGVLDAVRAGVGVALLADVGTVPAGLERRPELPAVDPEPMHIRTAHATPPRLVSVLGDVVRAAFP